MEFHQPLAGFLRSYLVPDLFIALQGTSYQGINPCHTHQEVHTSTVLQGLRARRRHLGPTQGGKAGFYFNRG